MLECVYLPVCWRGFPVQQSSPKRCKLESKRKMSRRRSQLRRRSAPKKEIDSGLVRELVYSHQHGAIFFGLT